MMGLMCYNIYGISYIDIVAHQSSLLKPEVFVPLCSQQNDRRWKTPGLSEDAQFAHQVHYKFLEMLLSNV
jgi:hypothetical protein